MQLKSRSMPQMRFLRGISLLSASLLLGACDNPAAPVPAVKGIVTVSATGAPVAGAKVSIGEISVTTGSDGKFEITGVVAGPAKIRGTATGFESFEADITVPDGPATQNISLKRTELFEFTDFAVYVPASVVQVRGVLVTLGGPDTRGFASGGVFGAPMPAVETALQTFGVRLRAMAATKGLAIIGTSQASLSNDAGSDAVILQAVQQAATLSGREDLKTAPYFLYGLSGGGPEASGFTVRNAGRVAGLFLKAPLSVEAISAGPALGIPTYVVLEQLDVFVDNVALTAAYRANRAAGAPWALALELGSPHHSLSPQQSDLTAHWMDTILGMRLGNVAGDALRAISESSGWVGDASATQVLGWSSYSGNPRSASWFPSQGTAEEWLSFIKLGSP